MTANAAVAIRIQRRTMEPITASSRLVTRPPTMTMDHTVCRFGSSARRVGRSCRKNATLNPAAERATADSTRRRLSGLRTCRPWGGAARDALVAIAAVGVEPRQDAVLDRSTEQVDLRRS